MTAVKIPQKKTIPPPGPKLTLKEAIERANKKFGKALAMLAK